MIDKTENRIKESENRIKEKAFGIVELLQLADINNDTPMQILLYENANAIHMALCAIYNAADGEELTLKVMTEAHEIMNKKSKQLLKGKI